MALTFLERERMKEIEEERRRNDPVYLRKVSRSYVALAQFALGQAINIYYRDFDRDGGIELLRMLRKLKSKSVEEQGE